MEKEAGSQAPSHAARPSQDDLVELSSSLDGISTGKLDGGQARRVAALKKRVQEGAYRVDSTLVARKMLSSGSGI